MKLFSVLFFLSQCYFSFSQHSERFINLVENLKPSDSSTIEEQYSDGTLKKKGTLFYYDMPEYNYSKRAGLWMEYYNNGEIRITTLYDDFGNVLNKSIYDLQGSISSEMTATLVDTEVLNPNAYFLRNDEVTISFRVKNYKFSTEIDGIYLREVGLVKGGKRIGVWKLYTQSGRLEKEVNYNDK